LYFQISYFIDDNSFTAAFYRGDVRPVIAVTTEMCWSKAFY